MPATPWRSLRPADPSREYLVLLSFLPLKRLWRTQAASRIVKLLQRGSGNADPT